MDGRRPRNPWKERPSSHSRAPADVIVDSVTLETGMCFSHCTKPMQCFRFDISLMKYYMPSRHPNLRHPMSRFGYVSPFDQNPWNVSKLIQNRDLPQINKKSDTIVALPHNHTLCWMKLVNMDRGKCAWHSPHTIESTPLSDGDEPSRDMGDPLLSSPIST